MPLNVCLFLILLNIFLNKSTFLCEPITSSYDLPISSSFVYLLVLQKFSFTYVIIPSKSIVLTINDSSIAFLY